MWPFQDKKEEIVLSKTIKDLCERLGNLESKLTAMEFEFSAIKYKVLRKLEYRSKQEEQETGDKMLKEEKNLKTFSPFL
jgi:hypothetical protein